VKARRQASRTQPVDFLLSRRPAATPDFAAVGAACPIEALEFHAQTVRHEISRRVAGARTQDADIGRMHGAAAGEIEGVLLAVPVRRPIGKVGETELKPV